MKSIIFAATTFITLSANASVLPLETRLGGLAYYDPNLNITWAADANINGSNFWGDQMTWVANLNIGGVTGWRLPSADVNGDTMVVNCVGGGLPNCSDNEMGFLYYDEGITAATPGPFNNLLGGSAFYWTETSQPGGTAAWIFGFGGGGSGGGQKVLANTIYAWAVHDGDVSAVPIPAAVWLLGSSLLGLMAVAKRKKS